MNKPKGIGIWKNSISNPIAFWFKRVTSNNNISLVLTNDILIIFYSPIVFLQLLKAKKEFGIIYLSQ